MERYYRIGEVAQMLNLSNEMIRYYEKCGIIQPIRSEINQYRAYTIWDFYALTECMVYQQLGANIKDIPSMLKDHYSENVNSQMLDKIQQLRKEIEYNTLLVDRLTSMAQAMEYTAMNLGNYWVARQKPRRTIHFTYAVGDSFEPFSMSAEVGRSLFAGRVLPFLDGIVRFEGRKQSWCYSIEEQYFSPLEIQQEQEFLADNGQYCFCTAVDMGELNSFDQSVQQSLIDEAKKRGYQIIGNVEGILRVRGYTDQQFHRWLELQLPIEKP